MRNRHLHLSAIVLHHAAADALFRCHLRVRSHTRHRRCHKGHEQQQDSTELAQRLHSVEEYANAQSRHNGNCREVDTRTIRISELSEFRDIGKRMLLAWQEGITSLRDRRVYSAGDWAADKVFEGISDPPTLETPRTARGRSPLLGSRSSRSKK